MAQVKFYRGLKANYVAETTHKDGIYFATDTNEILMNGKAYAGALAAGKVVTNVTLSSDKSKLVITYSDTTTTEIDLSAYYNKTQVDAAIAAAVVAEKTLREAADTALGGKITTNTQAIAKINGSADAEGSLANTLKQAKDYADTKVSDISNLVANKVDKVEGSTLIPETKLALIDTNASDIDALEVRVAANEAKLVGITTTVVSTINTAIDAAMAWHEVIE